ncbi:MAG: hypothetical protein ABWY33_07755 [Cellulomonas sp.]
MGQRWERISTLLGARWEQRADERRIEAIHEDTRAKVRTYTTPIVGETAIDVPGTPLDVWDRLFGVDNDSSWSDPSAIEFTLPGPPHGQVGHRFGHVAGRGKRATGLIWEIVEATPGVILRTRGLSTRFDEVTYRLTALSPDRCLISIREQMMVGEADVDDWRAKLSDAQLRHLARAFVELTGEAPPATFADALARDPDAAAPADPVPLDPTGVVAVAELAAPIAAVWGFVRNLALAGFPDLEPGYAYAVMDGFPELWVGVRESSIGLPVAAVVEILDADDRRLVARRIGTVNTVTIELENTARGTLLNARVELAGRSDVVVGRWQRSLDRYLRHLERELGAAQRRR